MKFKGSIPSALDSASFASATNDQDTDTTHKNQDHIKETHKKSSAGHGANHGLKGGSALHPKGKFLVKDETQNSPMHRLDTEGT